MVLTVHSAQLNEIQRVVTDLQDKMQVIMKRRNPIHDQLEDCSPANKLAYGI